QTGLACRLFARGLPTIPAAGGAQISHSRASSAAAHAEMSATTGRHLASTSACRSSMPGSVVIGAPLRVFRNADVLCLNGTAVIAWVVVSCGNRIGSRDVSEPWSRCNEHE